MSVASQKLSVTRHLYQVPYKYAKMCLQDLNRADKVHSLVYK